ncbi:GNAT family N-acetyltransferase [Sphingosinicella humi]|uniref:GNAT family N-acetyltransferase n=2 Tax=Allosphingosinicella humi TaxID=2068657 RepID=A0A2U2IYT9_9SPHN|nr:GNAT family N-acetyltransferase [Sphingosinicella humi]
MLIRRAAPGDEAALWAILAPVIRAGDTYVLPRDMGEIEALTYWLGQDRETFVAEADGRILGTYYLRANQPGGGAHVANAGYMTAPEARGRGIASALCAHSLDRARERGFTAMQFNFVVATNTGAIRLWKRHGFEEVGRLPGAFIHPTEGPTDALVLFRTL